MIILRESYYTSNRTARKEAWKSAKKFIDICNSGNVSSPKSIRALNEYTVKFSPYHSSFITGNSYPKYLENIQKKARKYAVKTARKNGTVVRTKDID